MRIIFLGTSVFAVPSLRVLTGSKHEIVCVITRPPRPAGRGKKLRQPPLYEYARNSRLVIYQPEKLETAFIENLKSLEPDLMVSAAYGAWLPGSLLELSPLGVVNIHPSLLPEYRGAAPIARAILDGADETGVSFMLTDSGWDTGPVISAVAEKILPGDTTGSLEERLSLKAAEELIPVIEAYADGKLPARKQSGKTIYADKITTDETWLDWKRPALYLDRMIRAFQPSPGARTMYLGKTIKIAAARISSKNIEPGRIIIENDSLYAGCGGENSLEILMLQPSSKRVMNTDEYLRGSGMKTGDRFGKA